jgi:toxin ParE1/3/4
MSGVHEVVLTEDAAQDLQEIYDYIADHVLERIEAVLDGLARFPQRGAFTKELLAIGMREYRETYFKPYRVIDRVIGQRVYVYLIADGRRDMQALLHKRMLRG